MEKSATAKAITLDYAAPTFPSVEEPKVHGTRHGFTVYLHELEYCYEWWYKRCADAVWRQLHRGHGRGH